MPREKVTFDGHAGALVGMYETPLTPARATVLFAHCFSCGKDVAAASRITRALAERGYAVLRFDFTGLGNSDGDFANTGFSSNVADLVAAGAWLREHHAAPSLLVGHSLGGSAVLAAAASLPDVRAVVTIGAPAEVTHVLKQFEADIPAIERDGRAEVSLAGRPFHISRQFLDDVRGTRLIDALPRLRKALLVMHSPTDATVGVGEAEAIFKAARHPKSFVALDGADHLLTRRQDAVFVADMIAGWAPRYLDDEAEAARVEPGEVRVEEADGKYARRVVTDHHAWLADEPKAVGGSDRGPDPYEHLLGALGTCTSMTMRMYANRKGLALDDITVTLRHARDHQVDCETCEDGSQRIEAIERDVRITGDLAPAERERLLQIADRCPVHRTITNDLAIVTREVVG